MNILCMLAIHDWKYTTPSCDNTRNCNRCNKWQECAGKFTNGKIFWVDATEMYPAMFRCFLDGNALCVVKPTFVNSAESDAFYVTLTKKELVEIRKTFPEVGVYD